MTGSLSLVRIQKPNLSSSREKCQKKALSLFSVRSAGKAPLPGFLIMVFAEGF
jgi:hypothetical protein